jgi:tetratricopeptide (TPR) repeat protein
MRRLIACVAAGLIITGVVAASAQSIEAEMGPCRAPVGSDTAVAACTRLITSGRMQGALLATIYGLRAMHWYQKGDRDRALADYDAGLRIDKTVTIMYHGRGTVLKDKGEFDRALADFNQAIRLDPKQALFYHGRAGAYVGKREFDRAVTDLSEAIRLDPKNAVMYQGRAGAFSAKGEFDRAIADLDEAIRIDPRSVFFRKDRSIAYRNKGDLDRAIAEANELIKLDPSYNVAYVSRGLAYEMKNDIARARADFETALTIRSKYFDGNSAQQVAREKLAVLASPQQAAAPAGAGVITPPPAAAPAAAPAPPIQVAVAPPASRAPAVADRRVALVIGNSGYTTFPRIPNPRNDAEDLAAGLKALGFDVLLGLDLSRSKMEDMLIEFARRARQSDTALVFYAGHGLQHNGINYLAPIDAKIDDEGDLRRLINLQDVMNDLQSASRVRILIVDACRDNEVIKQLAGRLPSTRSAAFTRGLARVDAADGTLVTFATQPNRVAADGQGRNSPFTQALLKHLATPGLELRVLMTRVRSDVVGTTGGTQRPEVWDSLVGEFAFKAAP